MYLPINIHPNKHKTNTTLLTKITRWEAVDKMESWSCGRCMTWITSWTLSYLKRNVLWLPCINLNLIWFVVLQTDTSDFLISKMVATWEDA